MADRNLRINEQIAADRVRLIDQSGAQCGLVSTLNALAMAREAGLDLVEVAPGSVPPVCKIIDYGKHKFDQEKWSRDQRKQQKLVKLKEVRMQPKIDQHDLNFKTKRVQGFLGGGNRVKITIRFRGRELAYTELGRRVLEKVMEILDEGSFSVDSPPRMEGRMMSMVLNPGKKK